MVTDRKRSWLHVASSIGWLHGLSFNVRALDIWRELRLEPLLIHAKTSLLVVRCLLSASVERSYRYVQLGGDPGQNWLKGLCIPFWLGNTLGSTRRSWKELPGRRMSALKGYTDILFLFVSCLTPEATTSR